MPFKVPTQNIEPAISFIDKVLGLNIRYSITVMKINR